MSNIFITIKKELRAVLRDKKSLRMMLVLPLLIPVIIIIFSDLYSNIYKENMGEDSTKTYTIGVNYNLSKEEKDIIKALKLKTKKYDSKKELNDLYEDNKLSAYIIKNNNKYTIYSNINDTDSITVAALGREYLNAYNEYLGHLYLVSINADLDKVDHSIMISTKELKGSNEFVNMLLFLGIMYSFMAISLTAIYTVTDCIAGEKERGTLETLLTFPIKSRDLIIGKYLATFIACVITSVISCTLVLVSIMISSNIFEIYQNMVFKFNFSVIVSVLLLMISFSTFISGLCIAIASFTKSYKEAQSSLTPVNFLCMVPMFMFIMDKSLDTKISFIPVISHTLLANDIITLGFTSNSLLYLFIIIFSTLLYMIILLFIIIKLYKNEKVLFSN